MEGANAQVNDSRNEGVHQVLKELKMQETAEAK
jgi:hypothetical protein